MNTFASHCSSIVLTKHIITFTSHKSSRYIPPCRSLCKGFSRLICGVKIPLLFSHGKGVTLQPSIRKRSRPFYDLCLRVSVQQFKRGSLQASEPSQKVRSQPSPPPHSTGVAYQRGLSGQEKQHSLTWPLSLTFRQNVKKSMSSRSRPVTVLCFAGEHFGSWS